MKKPSKPNTKLQNKYDDIKAKQIQFEKRISTLEKEVSRLPKVIIGLKEGPPGPDTLP